MIKKLGNRRELKVNLKKKDRKKTKDEEKIKFTNTNILLGQSYTLGNNAAM